MAKNKKKLDARAFAQQRRKRRQWLSFVRMVRYGVNNFSRNAWLTVAATAVMTITLLIIFATFAARSVLSDTVSAIRQQVSVSIYVQSDISGGDVTTITNGLNGLSSVNKVQYISPNAARTNFAQENSSNPDILNALNQASGNVFPGAFVVNLKDINNTAQLEHYVNTNSTVQSDLDPNNPPSYAGDKKVIIQKIGSWINLAQEVGFVMSIIFIVISSLIIFNTIRMAIFNRKDEIEMMKLIGADRSFIRGPFVVEAIVYGFIAAIVGTAIGMGILYSVQAGLQKYGVAIVGTVNGMTTYVAFVLLAMIIAGAIIGILSSLLATRRYLKI